MRLTGSDRPLNGSGATWPAAACMETRWAIETVSYECAPPPLFTHRLNHPPPSLSAPPLQDLSTRRNAFHMLAEHAQDKAVTYLFQQIDRVADWGDILQIAVLDLIRKVGLGWWACGKRFSVRGWRLREADFAMYRLQNAAQHTAAPTALH